MGKKVYKACLLLLLTTACHGINSFNAQIYQPTIFKQFDLYATDHHRDDPQKENALIELINTLVPYKVDINSKDDRGRTLLHYAAKYAFLRVVQYLISKNINKNALDNDGCTALHILAQERGIHRQDIPYSSKLSVDDIKKISKIITIADAISVPVKKPKREYPFAPNLHRLVLERELLKTIARSSHESLCRAEIGLFLLECDAVPDVLDEENQKPSDYAQANNYEDLARALLIFETNKMLEARERFLDSIPPTGSHNTKEYEVATADYIDL